MGTHADFTSLCTAKFERGRMAHPNNPWDKAHIDSIGEMKEELYDLYNYADLLDDANKRMKIRTYVKVMWDLLND